MALADPRAPVLVGVGEASGQKLKESQGLEWPSTVDLAAAAIQQALADSGAEEKLAASIDCLLSIRLFHDSGLPHDFGSPENHPEAVAAAAGLDPEDGVVRVSLVHYNTPEEIERLIDVLEKALA